VSWFRRAPKPTLEEIIRREVRAAVREAVAPFERLIVVTAASYVETVTPGKGGKLDDIELAFAQPPDPDDGDQPA
jgi:hypothetical protein